MTGGDVVYRTLVEAGVEHVFGVVSVHNLPIYDAIDRGGKITAVAVRHEQAAVHAADGYARATGKLGVALTSTGPGAANAVAGLYEAGFASSPVLMITGQIDTSYLGKGRGFLHEAEQQAAMLRAVSRRVETVRLGQRIGPALALVIDDLLTGRPQPGCVEIPIDLQAAALAEDDLAAAPASRSAALEPAPAAVARAAELLARAERPLLIAGGGVLRSGGAERSGGAAAELRALVERLPTPVLLSTNGRGALADDHPLCLGALLYHPETQALQEEADRLPITICLFNDRGYGILRRVQAARYAGRTFAVDLETPDFPALARSMGAAAHAVGSVEQFAAAFDAALAEPGPVLLDIDLNALHPMGEYPPRRR